MCHTDVYAHVVLQAAASAGARVPDRVSVIGIEDAIAPFLSPPLCTFDCHLHQLGVSTAALLGQALEEPDAVPKREMIRPTFVCRASCGPARPARSA